MENEEDVALVRNLLSESRSALYALDRVARYEEGMARLRRDEHDVCLMDDHLEENIDGLTVLQSLARLGCRVPIILLTRPGDLETGPAALTVGAADYLDQEELTDNVLERSLSILERSIRYAAQRRKAQDALRGSQERLIEAELRKDELLAMLAHELRNPLAPIRYALQTLRLETPGTAHMQRQRDLIERQVTHMARLLDDLLDVSRMTRGKIHLQKEKLDLGEVVDQAVEAIRPLVKEYHQEFVYARPAEPLWIDGDRGRLEQVLGNLLYNAAKFTKAGGRIWVNVEPRGDGARSLPALAAVHVVDNGIGIEPEMLTRIFDLFTQTDETLNRAQGGLGIGLTMVKHLVQMHGGTVRASSEGLGKGSEFEILLPLLEHPELSVAKMQPARRATGDHEEEPVHHGRPQRVLVVEDNLDSANSLAELIGVWGHQTRVVNDGPAAIEAATAFQPDVVLLDIGLPGMNGYQVARLIRSRPALKGALLVALTGFGREEDRRCAELAGFDRHFTKPVELEDLHSLLDRAA